MRLGIYGGTFDPVHFGHLLLAETCREACGLDEVWFIPAAIPPHKPGVRISSSKDRLQMLEFAIAGHPQFKISRIELNRTGPSFTIDTLQQLLDEQPDRELYLLIGGDSLDDFPTWRQPERILELASVVAVNRGPGLLDVDGMLSRLDSPPRGKIQTVLMPAVDISASRIRTLVAQGKSIRYQTPRPVEMYILQKGLYREG